MDDATKKAVDKILIDRSDCARPETKITDPTTKLSRLGMDSLDAIALEVTLEEELGISLEPDWDHATTIAKVLDDVDRALAARRPR